MKVLAVDTSGLTATVAVIEDDSLLGEFSTNYKLTHSEKLMPMVDTLLKNIDMDIKEIDIYACASGPGSFTGLRIGVTAMKTLAYVSKKPLVMVPTLDGLAFCVSENQAIICPIMDARNAQVYTAFYTVKNNNLIRISDYSGIPIQELADEIIKNKYSKCIFTGDGILLHEAFLKEKLGDVYVSENHHFASPRGVSIASLALQKYNCNEINENDVFESVPFYLRKSQAERMRDLKNEGKA